MDKIIRWLMDWEEPNKFHPSIYCDCQSCNIITELQIR